MYLDSTYIEPAQLTGYVRAALADFQINQFQLAQWLPNRNVDDLDYRFQQGGEGLSEAANFRSYDTEAQIGSRPGITRVTGELPPISRKLRLGEYDRLRQRREGGDPDSIVLGLEGDAERNVRSIAARIELARGDALVNGSITLNENGIVATVDFSRPAACSVTPSIAWSDTVNAVPITDLTAWNVAYLAMNGEPVGAYVISTQMLTYLAQNASLRNLAATVVGAPTMLSREHLQQTLAAFGLPPFFVYDAQVNVNSAATRILPSNKVLMLPPAVAPDAWEDTQLGGTFWGTTAEALEPGYGIEQSDQPGIVAGVYNTQDPVALWTKASAISLPVLANPKLGWVATVA